jgi:hypothetical protein
MMAGDTARFIEVRDDQTLSPADQFLRLIQNPFKTDVSARAPGATIIIGWRIADLVSSGSFKSMPSGPR